RLRAKMLGQEWARAKRETAGIKRAHLRLQYLYEISKLLTRFESVEETVRKVLTVASGAVPMHIAILVLEGRHTRSRTIAWHAEGVSASRLRNARAHAKTAYAYLACPAVEEPLDLEEEAETSVLPGAPTAPPTDSEEEKKGFIFLPLVVDRGRIFGGLQVQGAGLLDEADLVFINAVINQLAIALDRVAAVEARQAEAEAKRTIAEAAKDEAKAASAKIAEQLLELQHNERLQRFLPETH